MLRPRPQSPLRFVCLWPRLFLLWSCSCAHLCTAGSTFAANRLFLVSISMVSSCLNPCSPPTLLCKQLIGQHGRIPALISPQVRLRSSRHALVRFGKRFTVCLRDIKDGKQCAEACNPAGFPVLVVFSFCCAYLSEQGCGFLSLPCG